MGIIKKKKNEKDNVKVLEQLTQKKLERSMPQVGDEEKIEKEKGGSSRKGKF